MPNPRRLSLRLAKGRVAILETKSWHKISLTWLSAIAKVIPSIVILLYDMPVTLVVSFRSNSPGLIIFVKSASTFEFLTSKIIQSSSKILGQLAVQNTESKSVSIVEAISIH